MELTRAVSHLALANQQLAEAHNLTLGHLHRLLTQHQHHQQQQHQHQQPQRQQQAISSTARAKLQGRRLRGKRSRLRRLPAVDEPSSRDRDDVDFSRAVDPAAQRTKSELEEEQSRRLEVSELEGRRKDARLEEVTAQLRASELETARLLAELETFQAESKDDEKERRSVAEDQELFRKELTLKREMRQRALAGISAEMERLRAELAAERDAHELTKKLLEDAAVAAAAACVAPGGGDDDEKTDDSADRLEALRLSQLLKVSDEITNELWLQLERTDDLRFQLENEPEEHRLRIASLKRLAEETRSALRSRKQQVNLLKDRLAQLLCRLGDLAFLEDGDDRIREETERQIEDIGLSRSLGDERSRILAELKDHCFKQVHELKLKLSDCRRDNQGLEEELRKAGDKMRAEDLKVLNLESQLGLAKADCRDLQNQMSLINGLFTQMLMSASSAEMDLDRLTQLLQENHDLISDVAKENGTEAAALPKLLLDIIEQVDGKTRDSPEKKEDTQEESIAHNLPKVWRVLMELISCHEEAVVAETEPDPQSTDSCYKSVDTPTGPRLVISVSKTYIRLKDLILEKKHLQREMNRMKQLNTHLETKLSEQEKRLSTVSDELSKTWNIVGRMQVQHQQLHTHEKILRYELQQKRKMLQELKQELEYCREKWESARQKNNVTEIEWRSLRREFAARKAQDSFNNSGESGFSDEREEDESDDELDKRVRPVNSRRRSKKEEPRAITPDTESEQPTDTEVSECKTESSELRTPSPETEAASPRDTSTPNTPGLEPELDPLEKALSACIENMMESSTGTLNEGPPVVSVFSIGPVPSQSPNFSASVSQESSSSLETVKEAKSPAEVLDARAQRLRNLEEQAQLLVKRVNATNQRGSALNSRLEELHETYGSMPVAPPMPDVLPAFRLRTAQDADDEQ